MDHDYKKPSHCADCKAESNRRAETPHEYVDQRHCRSCKNEHERRRREANKPLAETPHPYVSARHCPACASEYNKDYYAKNTESCREYSRKYRAENPEKCREVHRNWRLENPGKVKAKHHRRRARIAAVPSDGIPYPLGDRCEVCYATDDLTVDHLVAISRGGPDTIGNKATFCGSCNSSKNSMNITDSRFTPWLVERRMAANI